MGSGFPPGQKGHIPKPPISGAPQTGLWKLWENYAKREAEAGHLRRDGIGKAGKKKRGKVFPWVHDHFMTGGRVSTRSIEDSL